MVSAIDEMEVLRRAVCARIINAGIFTAGQIQLDNEAAPGELPYCRLTLAASGKYDFITQRVMGQTVIAEADIFGSTLSDTRALSPYAAAIEAEFGKYDRSGEKRKIAMTALTGASAAVEQFGRGAEKAESGTGLYRIPVLLYVKVELEAGTTAAVQPVQTGGESTTGTTDNTDLTDNTEETETEDSGQTSEESNS